MVELKESLRKSYERHKAVRDLNAERVLKEFAAELAKEAGVEIPEIYVLPRSYIIQITDGDTDLATYKVGAEAIFINKDEISLYSLLHEFEHHKDYKQRGMQHVEDLLECQKKGEYGPECPIERSTDRAAERGINKVNIDRWERIVEPTVGKGKILASWMFGR